MSAPGTLDDAAKGIDRKAVTQRLDVSVVKGEEVGSLLHHVYIKNPAVGKDGTTLLQQLHEVEAIDCNGVAKLGVHSDEHFQGCRARRIFFHDILKRNNWNKSLWRPHLTDI